MSKPDQQRRRTMQGRARAKSSGARVTAVGWPDVLPVTRRTCERYGVADRYHFSAGDLAKADFGVGHDWALLGHILHSEGEGNSRRLLARVYAALTPGGGVAIAEFLADEDRGGPIASLLFALNMLVHSEAGSTFSAVQITRWLQEAGFVDVRQLEVGGPSPLILATKGPALGRPQDGMGERSRQVFRRGSDGIASDGSI